jgi:hypothetical protein
MGGASGSGQSLPSGRPDGETHHLRQAWLMGFAKVLNPIYGVRPKTRRKPLKGLRRKDWLSASTAAAARARRSLSRIHVPHNLPVIARRSCAEAIQYSFVVLDCFALLAMTGWMQCSLSKQGWAKALLCRAHRQS